MGAWSCSIEAGPPPELTAYLQSIDIAVSKVSSLTDNCSGDFDREKTSASKIEQNLISFYDEASLEMKLSDSIVLDFEYNLGTAFDGNSRAPVIAQGIILRNSEKKLESAFKKAWSTCNLDTVKEDFGNKSAREYLKSLLVYNRNVEYYYKSVVTGDTVPPVEYTNNLLFISIARNYSPEATSGCQNEYSFEKMADEGMKAVEDIWNNIKNSSQEWENEIKLFQGSDTDKNTYRDIQKKVLQKELVRQWLSQSQITLMLGNLTCIQNAPADATQTEKWKIASDCWKPIIWPGARQLENQISKLFTLNPPKTTDEHLRRTIAASTNKYIAIQQIADVWKEVETTTLNTAEVETNNQMLSDLVSIHMRLVNLNKLLKKETPAMQNTCDIANKDITWWCR
jgi:hypothetical protein